jgi:adenine deaminase
VTSLTRFSVKPLSALTRQLAAVASGRADPELVIKGARVLSTYSERLFETADGDLTATKIAALFDKWPAAVAIEDKMDFVAMTMGDEMEILPSFEAA